MEGALKEKQELAKDAECAVGVKNAPEKPERVQMQEKPERVQIHQQEGKHLAFRVSSSWPTEFLHTNFC